MNESAEFLNETTMKEQNIFTWLGMALIQLVVFGCVFLVAMALFVSCQMGLFAAVFPTASSKRQFQISSEQLTADARTCFAAMAYLLDPENEPVEQMESVTTGLGQSINGTVTVSLNYSSNHSDYFHLTLPGGVVDRASRS